jgi:hypothetical protein
MSMNNEISKQPITKDFTFPYVESMGRYSNIQDKRINPIPSNAIIYKTLPGIGATTAEILEQRNSIIVLPNLPVIKGKQSKHGSGHNTYAVYEDNTIEQLKNYLSRRDVPYKKIFTTPEGFAGKVKLAMKQMRVDMYAEYFLLFDEAHKYIADNNYRENIIMPFNDFFKFRNKAIISATPLKFSDPRFKGQNFSEITINPVYDFKKDITLIHTNNISDALRKYINENSNDHYCIFYNTIDGIRSLINNLDIQAEAKIFCSRFSKRELEIQKYNNVYDEFKPEIGLSKYNFFTSSFYNGLDIELGGNKPTVILLSSVKFADYTVIDPLTDAIQIFGRFRNGIRDSVHITDTSDKINYLGSREIIEKVNTSGTIYRTLKQLQLATPDPYGKKLYGQGMEVMIPYANLLNSQTMEGELGEAMEDEISDNERINWFRLDNFLHHHKVKELYSDINNLLEAYELSKAFNVTDGMWYSPVDEDDLLKKYAGKYTSPEAYKDITDYLCKLEGLAQSDPYEHARQIRVLEQRFSLIVNAYHKFGVAPMLALEFDHRRIQRLVIRYDAIAKINTLAVKDAVYLMIKQGSKLPCSRIKVILGEIYSEYDVDKIATATDIEHFFKVRKVSKVKVIFEKQVTWQRGYEIIEPLFNQYKEYRRN